MSSEGIVGDSSSTSPWHLLWILPAMVAIIFSIWEIIEDIYIPGYIIIIHTLYDLMRSVVATFIVTLIAIIIVRHDQKLKEAKLEQAYKNLKELDEMKNNFLSNVSHELKTPLTTINGYVKFMKSQKPGSLNEKQVHYLNIMSEESDRLKHNIEELLFVSTLKSKKIPMVKEDINLYRLGLDIGQTFKVKADEKNIDFRVSVKKGCRLRSDKARITQLITNLLENSLKYTKKNGSILLRILESGKNINIQVIDSGIGIQKDKHELVFKRFYQVDSKITRRSSGTGLGLAICLEIVNANKGTIRIESPLSQKSEKALGATSQREIVGTKFDIILPSK